MAQLRQQRLDDARVAEAAQTAAAPVDAALDAAAAAGCRRQGARTAAAAAVATALPDNAAHAAGAGGPVAGRRRARCGSDLRAPSVSARKQSPPGGGKIQDTAP